MQTIREQLDLALLPAPRFISTASAGLRWSATGFIVIGALIGVRVFIEGIADGGKLIYLIGGPVIVAICLTVLVFGRPTDWRVWINLAGTPEGLYLVAGARRVVFVPWRDVIEIGVEKITTHRGIASYARLTLRLPEEGWAQFGNISSIKGTGAVRQYLLSALTTPGDVLVGQLEAFRNANG